MTIDWSRLRSLTARELIAALHRDGFLLRRQTGSHQHYRHADGRRVSLPFHHPGDTFKLRTLRSIIQYEARWNRQDLIRLGLLR